MITAEQARRRAAMTALIPAIAQFAGRQLRAWLLVKLAGHSSVAVNLDITGHIRLRGAGLVHNCRFIEPRVHAR